ncbi:MAG: aminotransferase class IV, partial [Rhodospirillales bacterium]
MAEDILSFDDRDGAIWLDGKMIPWRDAKLHVLTHGLHYASSVFEGERSYGGKIFESRAHSERLHNSARILDFKIPYSVDELEKAKYEVLRANNIIDGYVRPIAWRGAELMGVSAQANKIHVAI